MTAIRIKATRSKYGVRTDAAGKLARTVDGIVFASQAEAKRYGELKLLEKAGEIDSLAIQPKFPLKTLLTTGAISGALRATVGDYPVIGHYVADFQYFDNRGRGWVTEDVKGVLTDLSRWKIKHYEAQYGKPVTLIRRATR